MKKRLPEIRTIQQKIIREFYSRRKETLMLRRRTVSVLASVRIDAGINEVRHHDG